MTKPDWAERLQRTFQRKYNDGVKTGYDAGYSLGYITALIHVLKELQQHGSTGDNLELPWSTVYDILTKAAKEKKN